MRPWTLIAVSGVALLCAGCERGCLSTWLSERGLGTAPQGATPATTDGRGIDLRGVDCPDGLARCAGGVIEVSRAFHYRDPCKGPPEQCRCPWERLGECPRGCAADGVEIDVPRGDAARQLCAPAPGEVVSRAPSAAAPAPACDATYACTGGAVVACGPPASAAAICARGCAREGQSLDEPELTPASAAALLCARAPRADADDAP